MNSIYVIPASIRHAFVTTDGSPLEDSWLCLIYASDNIHKQNVATGLLMFLAKYYKKAKQTNPPKFVLNSENKEISVFIRGTYCGYVRCYGEFTLENFVIGSPHILRRRMTGNAKTREEQSINLNTDVGVSRAVRVAVEHIKALDAKKIHSNYNSIADNVVGLSTTDSYAYIYETAAVLDSRETRKKLYGSIVGDISNISLSDKENTLWLLYALCKCGNSSWDSDSFMSAEELSELAKNAVNDLGKFTDRMDALLKERQKHSFMSPTKPGKLIIHVTPENSVYICNGQELAFYGDIALTPAWVSRVIATLDVADGSHIRSVGVRVRAFPLKEFTGGDFKATGAYYAVYQEQAEQEC
jgi:hypothetical protein